ncbi:PREDICTED: protein sprouty homolog 3 [Corvus brachyrhynchos]|uniref:protein sprouty homolog 3 n=1 Tax=Corvus brachyrhynchos TaxID=85066 RepID=UPI0004DE1267|nr:PREDICTED: protein sprouty homolog 3 [Corvus brachyrhynchos]
MQLSSSVAELSCDETMDPPAEDFQQVLSIDQIRSIRASNNYVERPAACFQQARSNPSLSQPPHKQEWSQDRLASSTFQDLHRSHSQQHQMPPLQPHLSHSSTASSVAQSTTASLLSPCLCCYFPTLGCLKLCQRGYDGLKRPGCRCQSHTNTVCRKISSASGTPFPKTLDKPV